MQAPNYGQSAVVIGLGELGADVVKGSHEYLPADGIASLTIGWRRNAVGYGAPTNGGRQPRHITVTPPSGRLIERVTSNSRRPPPWLPQEWLYRLGGRAEAPQLLEQRLGWRLALLENERIIGDAVAGALDRVRTSAEHLSPKVWIVGSLEDPFASAALWDISYLAKIVERHCAVNVLLTVRLVRDGGEIAGAGSYAALQEFLYPSERSVAYTRGSYTGRANPFASVRLFDLASAEDRAEASSTTAVIDTLLACLRTTARSKAAELDHRLPHSPHIYVSAACNIETPRTKVRDGADGAHEAAAPQPTAEIEINAPELVSVLAELGDLVQGKRPTAWPQIGSLDANLIDGLVGDSAFTGAEADDERIVAAFLRHLFLPEMNDPWGKWTLLPTLKTVQGRLESSTGHLSTAMSEKLATLRSKVEEAPGKLPSSQEAATLLAKERRKDSDGKRMSEALSPICSDPDQVLREEATRFFIAEKKPDILAAIDALLAADADAKACQSMPAVGAATEDSSNAAESIPSLKTFFHAFPYFRDLPGDRPRGAHLLQGREPLTAEVADRHKKDVQDWFHAPVHEHRDDGATNVLWCEAALPSLADLPHIEDLEKAFSEVHADLVPWLRSFPEAEKLPLIFAGARGAVTCGNGRCTENLADPHNPQPREQLVCRKCYRPVRNRCGNPDCTEDGLKARVDAMPPSRPGMSPEGHPYTCPTCGKPMRTHFWRCPEPRHAMASLHSHDHDVCPECLTEYLDGRRPWADVRHFAADERPIACPGCEDTPAVAKKVVWVPVELLPYYRRGVTRAERPAFLALTRKLDFQEFDCPNHGHRLFPSLHDKASVPHHLHLAADGWRFSDRGSAPMTPRADKVELFTCDHCGFPVCLATNEHGAGYQCPRCLVTLVECPSCSHLDRRLFVPEDGTVHHAACLPHAADSSGHHDWQPRCPRCTNLISHARDLATQEGGIHRPAFCTNVFGCRAGANLLDTAAGLRRGTCRACESKTGWPLRDLAQRDAAIDGCPVCRALFRTDDEPIDVNTLFAGWDAQKPWPSDPCVICGTRPRDMVAWLNPNIPAPPWAGDLVACGLTAARYLDVLRVLNRHARGKQPSAEWTIGLCTREPGRLADILVRPIAVPPAAAVRAAVRKRVDALLGGR